MGDEDVNSVFARECWADPVPPMRRFCVSDEHYIPTLLAALGLDAETDCQGGVTHTSWAGNYFHPKTYGKHEVKATTGGGEPRHWGG